MAPGRAFSWERHAVALESGIQGRVLFTPAGPEQHLAASLEVRMGAGEAGAHFRPRYFSKQLARAVGKVCVRRASHALCTGSAGPALRALQ